MRWVFTGKVEWENCGWGFCWLTAEYTFDGYTDYKLTSWTVEWDLIGYRAQCLGRDLKEQSKWFLTKKKAKAYAEVCYRMGAQS